MFSIVPDFNLKEWERSLEEVLLMDFETSVFLNDKCKYFMALFQGCLFPQLWGEPSGGQQAGRGGGTSGLQQVRLPDCMTLPQFMRDLKAEVMSMLMQGLSTAKVGGAGP